MKKDYKLVGNTVKLDATVEEEVIVTLKKMAEFSKHTVDEMTNTALKRFISSHKDFLPPEERDSIFR